MAENRNWLSPYQYTQNNPISRIDPDGALDTWYVDKDMNTLMQTNDGSNDVVVVSDDKVNDFKRFNQLSRAPGMSDYFDGSGFNNHWKGEFGVSGKQLSQNQISLLGQLNSDWARGNAVTYFLNPTAGNAVSFATSEYLSQWTNPELVTIGLSAGVAGYSSLGKLTKPSVSNLRNGHLAGKIHPKIGVPFTRNGFPDFKNYLYSGGKNSVSIKPTGTRGGDFSAANKVAGYASTPRGHTWHHHQTRGRMQLVNTSVHAQTGHTGGFSLWYK